MLYFLSTTQSTAKSTTMHGLLRWSCLKLKGIKVFSAPLQRLKGEGRQARILSGINYTHRTKDIQNKLRNTTVFTAVQTEI